MDKKEIIIILVTSFTTYLFGFLGKRTEELYKKLTTKSNKKKKGKGKK
jgi:hypothetical protein